MLCLRVGTATRGGNSLILLNRTSRTRGANDPLAELTTEPPVEVTTEPPRGQVTTEPPVEVTTEPPVGGTLRTFLAEVSKNVRTALSGVTSSHRAVK